MVNRLDAFESLKVGRKGFEQAIVDCIPGADLDFIKIIQHIEFCQGNLFNAVDFKRVFQAHHVEPAAAPRAAGCRPEFVADGAKAFADAVGVFRREGSVTDAGGVGLHDADNILDSSRRNPQPCARAAARRVGGGDKRICSMVDVEQRPLRPFGEDILFLSESGI